MALCSVRNARGERIRLELADLLDTSGSRGSWEATSTRCMPTGKSGNKLAKVGIKALRLIEQAKSPVISSAGPILRNVDFAADEEDTPPDRLPRTHAELDLVPLSRLA